MNWRCIIWELLALRFVFVDLVHFFSDSKVLLSCVNKRTGPLSVPFLSV